MIQVGDAVKLIDLGIAKIADGGLAPEGFVTQEGTFLGKIRYASPEQFGHGGTAAVGPPGDFYSAGVVLYELLTGRSPYRAAKETAFALERAVLEETRAEQRSELIQGLKEGMVLDGVVKNITDYGAFVDLGGVDGLLHVTDIAWRRINHPSEALTIGQQVKVQVIRFNPETQRISLGMKQLMSDPWDGVALKYPVGAKFSGRVTNITDYGAFVELEPGVEGLVHVSEMSWTKKNVHPGKIVSTSQEVDVKVLEVDGEKRRISLGLKQAQTNPWSDFAEKHPVGSQVEGEVKNATEFGLFIGLDGDVDGMVHMSDIA